MLPERTVHELDATDVAGLLRSLGLRQEAYLVIRREEILTRDVRLQGTDEVEVWPVISGGSGPGDPGERWRAGEGAGS